MKNRTIMTVALLLLWAQVGQAKTDVKAATTQLKQNEENAKANLQQYKENADIAAKNINEVKLDKISGSSLTPQGFNNALEKIKQQAGVSS